MELSDVKVWRGFYNVEETYVLYDAVYSPNNTYICIKDTEIAGIPVINTEFWQVLTWLQ